MSAIEKSEELPTKILKKCEKPFIYKGFVVKSQGGFFEPGEQRWKGI